MTPKIMYETNVSSCFAIDLRLIAIIEKLGCLKIIVTYTRTIGDNHGVTLSYESKECRDEDFRQIKEGKNKLVGVI